MKIKIKFLYILVYTIAIFTVLPLVPLTLRVTELLFKLNLTAVLLMGYYAVARRKKMLLAAMLVLPIISLEGWHFYNESKFIAGLSWLVISVFSFYTVSVLFLFLFKAPKVTTDIMIGAVCVYLFIGFSWTVVYSFLETVNPGAFYAVEAANPDLIIDWSDLMLFSFDTLTTLGYGDITPSLKSARVFSVMESVAGVVYVGVMLARLVGIHSQSQNAIE